MTHPDEPTISDEPQKAHGDALEELVQASPDDGDGSGAQSGQAESNG